ncbi:hypothetical protein ANO11243_087790 [Dothideomycetidae sp. 11243]|nr:hypothetical protein ANO11243_087790 [fungal sp. No.11243]
MASHHITPLHSKANADINSILTRLRAAGLPFNPLEHAKSPSTRTSSAEDQIVPLIRFLFFQNKDELENIIDSCLHGSQPESTTKLVRLGELHEKLESARSNTKPVRRIDLMGGPSCKSTEGCEQSSTINHHTRTSFARLFHDETPLTGTKPPKSPDSIVSDRFHALSRSHSGLGTSTMVTTFSQSETAPPSQTESFYGTQSDFDEHFDLLGVDSPSAAGDSMFKRGREERVVHASNLHMGESGAPPKMEFEMVHFETEIATQRSNSSISLDNILTSHLLKYLHRERFVDYEIPHQLAKLDAASRFLMYRAFSTKPTNQESLADILRHTNGEYLGEESIQTWLKDKLPSAEIEHQSRQSFTAKMTVDPQQKNEKLLDFCPLPPRDVALSRLEKKFGPHRFLSVTFEWPTDKILSGLSTKDHQAVFRQKFRRLLTRPQIILGTTFMFFHVAKMDRDGQVSRCRLWFFAIRGPGIDETITLDAMIDWALNPIDNSHLTVCKFMSRMDLALSRTLSTIDFSPHQFDFSNQSPIERVLMNDGCSQMSRGAAREIYKHLRSEDCPFVSEPVVFQGRINGAKGIWTVADPSSCSNDEVWIEINESQLKVQPHKKDLGDECERGTWTFELVAFSTMPQSSFLYLDFLPILEDRGVSRQVMMDIVKAQLKKDFAEFEQSFTSYTSLRAWLSKTFSSKESRNRESAIAHFAGFPKDDFERVVFMLEHGFEVLKNKTLAEYLMIVLKWWLQDKLERLKIPSGMTVMPFGVADRTGSLAPGEICLNFSRPLVDVESGASRMFLEGEVLVARLPALRISDIQKVRAVYNPQLNHLTDVVVFSSKGLIPLASKLQGGDLDGDRFWLCWDERLAEPFKNAPVPLNAKPVQSYYGITQDKLTVKEMIESTKDQHDLIRGMIRRSTKLAFEDDMLGRVTTMHRRLACKRNSLIDPHVEDLATIHDIIIDSKKNGYRFSENVYKQFMRKIGQSHFLDAAPYESALKAPFKSPRFSSSAFILDDLVLNEVLPMANDFVQDTELKLLLREPNEQEDMDLTTPFRIFAARKEKSQVTKTNVKYLEGQIRELCRVWASHCGLQMDNIDYSKYKKALEDCYRRFCSIMPLTTPSAVEGNQEQESDSCIIEGWLEKPAKHAFCPWELYRASAFKSMARSKFAFHMAGPELCYLKSSSLPGSRNVVQEIHNIYRPRKARKILSHGKVMSARRPEDDDED